MKKPKLVLEQQVNGVPCVTIAQAAKRLGCSRQNIWTRVKRKTLEAIVVGSRIYIPVEALGGKAKKG